MSAVEHHAPHDPLAELGRVRSLAMVRAPHVPDPIALAETLRAAGLGYLEITFTTADAASLIRICSGVPGIVVGAGTLRSAADAEVAVTSGARYLVTPTVSEAVIAVGAEAGLPVVLGALTPTEVERASALGAAAVKIFPARSLGPRYLADLLGPFPGLRLIPSGGVDAENAADFIAAGAFAVTAGSSVLRPEWLLSENWAAIGAAAAEFVRQLSAKCGPDESA